MLKAEARLLCQRHVLCAAATFCATYHPLVSYFDVKTEEERNYIGYGKLDIKRENMCFSRSQVTHPSRGTFITSNITASIFGTGYKPIVESNYAEVVM